MELPLNSVTKKSVKYLWSIEFQKGFDGLKKYLMKAQVLAFLVFKEAMFYMRMARILVQVQY